ncbi:unnamed protein product, partial [Mesorhabditis belari]|uniref:ZP domain-containing protein n=1 Tax=Mesorhabditis belari TaxID=2138241 RepID=A0AAF3F329_9BILA
MFLLLFICIFVTNFGQRIPEGFSAKIARFPEARCDFFVREDGPDGRILAGTNLDTSLYYDIKCKPAKGFCLQVTNCTVSGDEDRSRQYAIIDHNGCSLESSLFGDVEYLSDFRAGVPNPFPIRFRGNSSTVIFYCITTLIPREHSNCEHVKCANKN